ncbi:MAG TPA: TRAP transporter small permease [Stellaceae bacterium]|nr:TRAP transporter small permease [Stellaceae bacterium]
MAYFDRLVLQRQRPLNWPALDPLEKLLMLLCGAALLGFSGSTLIDIVTRTLGYPVLSLQEITSACFVYGVFIGAGVASRRNDHLYLTAVADHLTGRLRFAVEILTRLVVLAVGLSMVWYGWLNFLSGFSAYRMPSMLPIAYLYAIIPISGALVALFSLEQIMNGWQQGFEGFEEKPDPEPVL